MTATEIAGELSALCPVLVLDACTCLDPARVGRAEARGEFRALVRLVAGGEATPPRVRLILPSLVRDEVASNREEVRGTGERVVREHLARHQSLDDLARLVGRPASSPPAGLAPAVPLVEDLLW